MPEANAKISPPWLELCINISPLPWLIVATAIPTKPNNIPLLLSSLSPYNHIIICSFGVYISAIRAWSED
jgi:hypothetical protein